MPWFRVDGGFAFHRKVVLAGNAAVGLWTRAGSWSAEEGTGGWIPDEMVLALGTKAQAHRLVDASLWRRVDGGYEFHDWDDRNPNAGEAKTAKRKRSVGGRLGNHRKWHVNRGITDPDCEFCEDET